jgi:hypothetical protein
MRTNGRRLGRTSLCRFGSGAGIGRYPDRSDLPISEILYFAAMPTFCAAIACLAVSPLPSGRSRAGQESRKGSRCGAA